MKVIRVKVKTIILVVAIIFITIPYTMYFVGEFGFNSNIYVKGNHLSKYTAGALKLYKAWPTFEFNKGRTRYALAMSNYNYMKEIMATSSSGSCINLSKLSNMEQALIAKSYLEEGVALGEKDSYYKNNINALINLEMTLGNSKEAFKLIEKAKSSKDEEVFIVGIFNEIVYYAKNLDYDKALEICYKYVDENNVLYNYINTINYMKCDIKALNENRENLYTLNEYGYPETKNLINNNVISSDILKDIDFVLNIQYYSENESDFKIEEKAYENLKVGKITGKIIGDNINIPNMKIKLMPYTSGVSSDWINNNLYINKDRIFKEQITYCNENGKFEFNNVRVDESYTLVPIMPSAYGDKVMIKIDNVSGENQWVLEGEDYTFNKINVKENEVLNININLNSVVKIENIKIDNKSDELIIKYNKIKEADSYGVEIGGNGVSAFIAPITNKDIIKIPLTNGSLQSSSVYYGDVDEKTGEFIPDPKCLVGTINGEEIYIGIIAYDKNGEIISRGNVFENEIKLKKKKLNEGEKLILDNKQEEGIKWLTNKLKEDPTNKEYIYPILNNAIFYEDYKYANELIDRLEAINKTGYDKACYYNENIE